LQTLLNAPGRYFKERKREQDGDSVPPENDQFFLEGFAFFGGRVVFMILALLDLNHFNNLDLHLLLDSFGLGVSGFDQLLA